MRRLLVLVFSYIPILISAQKSNTTAEISRLADLGKTGGILHNFHPSMARGTIGTGNLVSDVAASLANDPPATNFQVCIEKMFDKLKDPLTHIVIDKNTFVTLLTNNDSLPIYRLLEDSVLYVAFPTSFGSRDSIRRISWLETKQLEKYKSLVLDLRNKTEVYDDDYYFLQNFGEEYQFGTVANGTIQVAGRVQYLFLRP